MYKFKPGDIVICIKVGKYSYPPTLGKKYRVVNRDFELEEIPAREVPEWGGKTYMDFSPNDFTLNKGPYLSNQGTEINV